jgi:hypothetical protein
MEGSVITINIEVDETDLDVFARVFVAAQEKLARNGVSMTAEAHKRAILSRIFKTGLAEEQRRFVVDRVADAAAKNVQAIYRKAPERMA